MRRNFDLQRAVDSRLYVLHDQEYQYSNHVARIQKIVDRRCSQDPSPSFYMRQLNKTHHISREYHSQVSRQDTNHRNNVLLQKILKIKGRTNCSTTLTNFSVAYFEKRNRDQKRIFEENQAILSRVIRQQAIIDDKTPKRPLHHPPIPRVKVRKLPKLVNLRA